MNSQQPMQPPQPKPVNLPDFNDKAAVQQLTGLTLNVEPLLTELVLRGYSPAECLFVVCREVNAVLAVEYGLLVEQAARGLPLSLFSSMAGLRDRTTTRCNARIELILNRLPPMPVLTCSETRQQLPLSDTLLPSIRGYRLTADPQNKTAVSVQIGGLTKHLEPGGELSVKTLEEPVWVSGPGQTIRSARIAQPERSGTLADALPLPASKPLKQSLWSRITRKPT